MSEERKLRRVGEWVRGKEGGKKGVVRREGNDDREITDCEEMREERE